MRRSLTITILVFILTVQLSWADVPRIISYQGSLADGAGTPVTDGNYDLTFSLYDAATGGALLWTETQSVPVAGGAFDAILGKTAPLSLSFNAPYWLGIAVGANPEMTPRIEMTSSPYSLSVADGAVTNSKIANNAVTTPKIANFAISTDKIGNGAVITLKIANVAVTTPKIAAAAVTAAEIAAGAVTTPKIAAGAVNQPRDSQQCRYHQQDSQQCRYHQQDS